MWKVSRLYLGADFVTVTKFAEHKWKLLRPQLFEVLELGGWVNRRWMSSHYGYDHSGRR
jgi:hypothetical protein